MSAKPNANLLTIFDRTVKAARRLSPDEMIALMKLLSSWLGGPRFYTLSEVENIVKQEIARHELMRKRSGIVTPDQLRGQ